MGFFDKIKAGLTKTRDALSDSLSGLFSGGTEIDDDFYDELEESLILADLGVETAAKATAALRKNIRERHITKTEEARSALKEILTDMVSVGSAELDLSTTPSVVLVIGANAVVIEGCRIGHDAVVAAGAIVVGDVAPNTVVAGCPARVIKQKDEKTAGKTALVDALRAL